MLVKILLAREVVPSKNFDWSDLNLQSPNEAMAVLRSNEENLESKRGQEDRDE